MKESIHLKYSFCFLSCLLDRGHITLLPVFFFLFRQRFPPGEAVPRRRGICTAHLRGKGSSFPAVSTAENERDYVNEAAVYGASTSFTVLQDRFLSDKNILLLSEGNGDCAPHALASSTDFVPLWAAKAKKNDAQSA